MNPTVDVMQALSMAGGTTPFAALSDIVILRRTPTEDSAAVPLQDLVRANVSTRTLICRAATWWSCRDYARGPPYAGRGRRDCHEHGSDGRRLGIQSERRGRLPV